MAMTDSEMREVARELARKLFQDTSATATLNLDDLKAAVAAIGQVMEATGTQVNSQYPGATIEQAINQHFPAPFGAATLSQKAIAVALWAMKRGGII